MKYRFKIRGIYATALTRILIKEGMQPTQMSNVLRERFALDDERGPYDVIIIDKRDLQGARIQGVKGAVDQVLKCIRRYFEDSIIRRYRPQLYAIYVGRVLKDISNHGYLVDIGNGLKGVLTTNRRLSEGEKILVGVARVSLNDECELTENITIVGRYARLIKGGRNSVSNHIKDSEKRFELMTLAYSICPKGWGIRWRSSAEHASIEELMEEVNQLKEEAEKIEEDDLEEVKLVREGEAIAEVEFPFTAKLQADESRNEVIPTIRGHHYIKAWGTEGAFIVDYAEFLLKKGLDRDELSSLTWEFLSQFKPSKGDVVRIIHVRLRGRSTNLTPGKVIERNGCTFVLRRIMKSKGKYDGLGEEKLLGDYAETMFTELGPLIIHRYYRADGTPIGEYYNLNTPVELYRSTVRYIDLEVDVIRRKDGVVTIEDVEKLREALNEGMISREVYENTLKLSEEIRDLLLKGYSAEDVLEKIGCTGNDY